MGNLATGKFSTEDEGSKFQELKRLWLKSALEKSGRTQTVIAGLMDISPANLSALVNGHKSITDTTMDKAAAAMNLALPDLGIKMQLPVPPSPVANPVSQEMWDELVLQAKTNTRLLNAVLEQLEKRLA